MYIYILSCGYEVSHYSLFLPSHLPFFAHDLVDPPPIQIVSHYYLFCSVTLATFLLGRFLTPLPYQTHLLTHPHQTPRVHFNSESFQFCPRRPRLCATHAVSAATLAVLKVASRKSGKKKNLKSGQPFTSRKRAARKQNKNAQHSKKSGKK